MKPRRIVIVVILLALALLIGMRFYAQHRHVDVYVSRNAPMPGELAAGLHMEKHGISSVVRIDSPYESAGNKVLSVEEIGRIRSKLAWSKRMPVLVDAIFIHSTNQVSTRRTTSRFMEECELVKENNEWLIRTGKRTDLKNVKVFQ